MYEQRTAFIFCALHSKKDRRRRSFQSVEKVRLELGFF